MVDVRFELTTNDPWSVDDAICEGISPLGYWQKVNQSSTQTKSHNTGLRKADTACTVRSGERGDEECLLPDAVSEIRCRRAEEIPGKRNQPINNKTKHPPR